MIRDILCSNDPVLLSFAQSVLRDAGIEPLLADQHTAGIEGSIGAFPRRLRVLTEDVTEARAALIEAGLGNELVDPTP
jgi:Putative prokaryotic signal transducing protein